MALTKKAERTKARLLASAKKLIGEKGFDQVSVEDITKDSGVARVRSITISNVRKMWWESFLSSPVRLLQKGLSIMTGRWRSAVSSI